MDRNPIATKGAPAAGLKPLHVTIKGDPPGADPDPIIITADDEVVWDTGNGKDFDVHFDETPFAKRDFHARDNHSGAPVVQVPHGESRRFKYSVTVDGKTQDPIVIVRG